MNSNELDELLQMVVLLTIFILHFLYLRVLRPLRLLLDQVCEIVAALADIVTIGFMLLISTESFADDPTPSLTAFRSQQHLSPQR